MPRQSLPVAVMLIALACPSNPPASLRGADACGFLLARGDGSEPYIPQPGDLVLYSNNSVRSRIFFTPASPITPASSSVCPTVGPPSWKPVHTITSAST